MHYTPTEDHPTPETLTHFATGELPTAQMLSIHEHTAACASCYERIKEATDTHREKLRESTVARMITDAREKA